ncbi:MAG: CapA family protein [Enhygromyxa sp.]
MPAPPTVRLFLCGDVMLGRGVDQLFARSCRPRIYESMMKSAIGYIELAERVSGPIPRPVEPAYPWGDALELLDALRPDARIINLETALTVSEAAAPKGINYRAHPSNVAVLGAAAVDCCSLANNHVLDWGEAGLLETLATLERAGIATTGAGADLLSARAPARLELPGGGAILVFGLCLGDSGVPGSWAGGPHRAGVHFLAELSDATVDELAAAVAAVKRPGDLAIASIHWGGNWGYAIPPEHRRFAHALIDRAGVDLVHGHSSHHPKAIELHNERAIFYGCGDFLNDYEGIGGYEQFRPTLALMYVPTLERSSGRLLALELRALRIRKLRLEHAPASDRADLAATLDRECARFGRRIVEREDGALVLR